MAETLNQSGAPPAGYNSAGSTGGPPPVTPPAKPNPLRFLRWLKWPFRYLLITTVLFSSLYFGANYPGLIKWYKTKQAVSENASLPIARAMLWRAQPALPIVAEGELYIPRLGLKAPVTQAPDNRNTVLLDLLKKSVVHLAGTARAGEMGNAVIAGHSSVYSWDRSQQLGTVFAGLPYLDPDDLIWLKEDGVLAGYAVSGSIIVGPKDTSILAQENMATLTLFTCYPIGTSKNRLVVVAKLIEPDSPLPRSSEGTTLEQLPAVR